MEIKEIVKSYEEDIIRNLTTLVSYPSVLDTTDKNYPFGKANADCLAAALKICDDYGFKTKNLDNYCGYAEIGEGDEVIGVIGHLDVVPVAEGWSTPPFELTRVHDKLYGRGSSDDKGPVCCSMVALKIVKDMCPDMKKRIRLIMGCNEETGSRCLAHYVEKEGHVDWGFTPDGGFPGIHGEKGMVAAAFSCETKHIRNIEAGIASNVVPNKVTLELESACYDEEALVRYFDENEIPYELHHGDTDTLIVHGTSAHASMPELGINAIAKAVCGLKLANCEDPFIEFFYRTFALSTDGAGLGIDCKDAYGALTLNVGLIHQEGNVITGSIDIRFPVTMHVDDIIQPMKENCKGATLTIHGGVDPLYFAPESSLVSLLYQSYVEVTGDTEHKPMTMGGGTYAKGIKNTIAFGAEFPDGEDTHIHDNNEFILIDHLTKQTEIYVHALLKLLNA